MMDFPESQCLSTRRFFPETSGHIFFLQSSVSELPISVDEFHASEIDLT